MTEKVDDLKEIYQDFSRTTAGGVEGASRLLSLTEGFTSTAPRTTTREYYEHATNNLLHGRLKSQDNPDGSWEYYEYTDTSGSSTSTVTRYSSWKDVLRANYTQARKEVTVTTPSSSETTVSLAGHVVAKSKISRSFSGGLLVLSEQEFDGTDWHTTTRKFYRDNHSPLLLAGRLKEIIHADGTVESFAYEAPPTEKLKVTHSVGAGPAAAPTSGYRTITVYNHQDVAVSGETEDIVTGEVGSNLDPQGRPQTIVYQSGTQESRVYECCGLSQQVSTDNVQTDYAHDKLGRVWKTTTTYPGSGGAVEDKTAYAGLVTTTTRTHGATSFQLSKHTRHLNGDPTETQTPDADGDNLPEITTYTYTTGTGGGRIVTRLLPDGGTDSTESFRDGRVKKRSGTAVADTAYDYTVNTGLTFGTGGTYKATAVTATKLTATGGTNEWTMTSYDPLGRPVRVNYSGASAYLSAAYFPTTATTGSRGRLQTVTDADGVAVTYAYDAEGERISTSRSVPLTGGGTGTRVDGSVTDVVETETLRGTTYGPLIRTTTTWKGVTTRVAFRSGDGLIQGSRSFGNEAVTIRGLANASGAWTVVRANEDGTSHTGAYTKGGLAVTTTFKNSSGGTVALTSRVTNPLGRLLSTSESRTGTTTYGNHTAARIARSQTDPGSRVTTWTLDKRGRALTIDATDTLSSTGSTLSNITRYSYYPTGQVKASWGDQTYASFYIYDEQDRLTKLRTYRSLVHNTEPTAATTGYDETIWNYHPQRGWLAGKQDANGQGVGYTYTAAGRLGTRIWARDVPSSSSQITTTYGYAHGYPTSVGYNDNTAGHTRGYDAYGRLHKLTQGGHSWTYAYDPTTLRLDTETVVYDTDSNGVGDFTRVLDRSWDALERNTGWALKNGGTVQHTNTYTYEATAGRLLSVSDSLGDTFTYAYTPNSPRLIASVTKSGAGPHQIINTWESNRDVLDVKENKFGATTLSKYDYTVNAISQRTGVTATGSVPTGNWTWGYNARGEAVAADHGSNNAYDHAFEFDAIGNRKKSASAGLSLPGLDNHTANALNQYTAAQGKSLTYDGDGNLITDGGANHAGTARTYTWDAENRLVQTTNTSGGALVGSYRYDPYGRRIAKTAGGFTDWFIYDGWNLIAEYRSGTLQYSHTWGLDLSGSHQGAGSVGGLLSTRIGGTPYYPAYDGNGNITSYQIAAGSVIAKFDYSAFGDTIYTSGSTSLFNFRFSTKYEDYETRLLYYGYRYYSSWLGRWPSRDPIGERGGLNLYAIVGNNAVNWIDFLGLKGGERDCVWTIRGSHAGADEGKKHLYRSLPHSNGELRGDDPRKSPCGDQTGYVSCYSSTANGNLGDKAIPKMPKNDPVSKESLEKYPEEYRNKDYAGRPVDPTDLLNPDDAESMLEKSWNNALEQAKNELKKPDTCCKSVTIKIVCNDNDFKEAAGDWCGKSIKIP